MYNASCKDHHQRSVSSYHGVLPSASTLYPYLPIPARCDGTPMLSIRRERGQTVITSQAILHLKENEVAAPYWQLADSDGWIRKHPRTKPLKQAAARALREATVNLGNERLLRTHHRSLASSPFVYEAADDDGKEVWVVRIGTTPTPPSARSHITSSIYCHNCRISSVK